MDAKLYRCRTPTDWLCPCGRVARELRRQGVQHEQARIGYGKSHRAEVQELTGQRHVPVLVLDGDAIADSKRIVEHLRWRAASR
jgi:glutathione S-transferase